MTTQPEKQMNDDHSPQSFYESLAASLWPEGDSGLILSLPPIYPPPQADLVCQGEVVLRYGIELLHSPHCIIPAYFESENGAIRKGRAAWDFIWAKSQLYPRADVIGWRSDGQPLALLLKDLDLSEAVSIWAYADPHTPQPLGRIHRLDCLPETPLPELLARYARIS